MSVSCSAKDTLSWRRAYRLASNAIWSILVASGASHLAAHAAAKGIWGRAAFVHQLMLLEVSHPGSKAILLPARRLQRRARQRKWGRGGGSASGHTPWGTPGAWRSCLRLWRQRMQHSRRPLRRPWRRRMQHSRRPLLRMLSLACSMTLEEGWWLCRTQLTAHPMLGG